jgi:hypothetical protein
MKIALLFIGLALTTVMFISLDGKLLYYGCNIFNHKTELPWGIVPNDIAGYGGGLYFEDSTGECFISRAIWRYWNMDYKINIDSIKRYWYGKNIFIAEIKDTSNTLYYINLTESKDKRHDYDINVTKTISTQETHSLKTIEFYGKTLTILVLTRTALLIIGVVLIIRLYKQVKRKLKNKNTTSLRGRRYD